MSSLSTSSPYGMFSRAVNAGAAMAPLRDVVFVDSGANLSSLSQIKTNGARCLFQPVGSHLFYKDNTSKFSLAMWKARMDTVAGGLPSAQVRAFVNDGTILGFMMLDDLTPGSTKFSGGIPTLSEVEECARYAKSYWSFMPCGVRAANTYLSTLTFSTYSSLDFGWGQWIASRGNIQTYYQNNVNSGKNCKLGFMAGFNLLDGGVGTAPWNLHPGGGAAYGMSPTEITNAASAFAAIPECIGIIGWAREVTGGAPPDYYQMAEIQNALVVVANTASARSQGPINQQASGSTSASTVAGEWSYVGCGTAYRVSDGGKVIPTAPSSVQSNDLEVAITHTRDASFKSVTTWHPSWSLATRVSGTSTQGGELCAFYRIAGAVDLPSAFTMPGSGASLVAQGAQRFAWRGSSVTLSELLNATGSGTSWSQGTSSMGSVKAASAATIGTLCVIVAAKNNDYTGTSNAPAETTMSATSGDGVSWSRATMAQNLSGDDQAWFVDYGILSASLSVTTKRWTQDISPGSTNSGSGAGFMLFFLANSAVTGTSPSIIGELFDATVSRLSILSFKIQADGTTPITWDIENDDSPADATLDSSSGSFLWTPMSNGTFPFVITATNAFGQDSDSFVVTVTPELNVAPVVTAPGNKSVRQGELLSFKVNATDADGDALTYSLIGGAPTGMTIDSATGHILHKPRGNQAGTYPIVVDVGDGLHNSRSTFTESIGGAAWLRPFASSVSLRFGRDGGASSQFSRVG